MNVNLVLFKKNKAKKSFSVPSSVTVVGRRQDCDLCIPLMVVSRRHCEINQDQGRLKIRDLGSRNGTFVNGLLTKNSNLNPGDTIGIGPLSFSVQIDGVPALQDDSVTQPSEDAERDKDMFISDAQDFADMTGMDDLDMPGADRPGRSTTEVFNDIPEELRDNS